MVKIPSTEMIAMSPAAMKAPMLIRTLSMVRRFMRRRVPALPAHQQSAYRAVGHPPTGLLTIIGPGAKRGRMDVMTQSPHHETT
ncbi:MAG: hypothetical protein ABI706_09095 [Ilumatobacteraceae bacterium]